LDVIIVFTTVSGTDEAAKLAGKVVKEKLAACVQVMPIASHYFWDGEVRSEPEQLLLIKTFPEKYDELERFIEANHPYEVPEIIAVDAERVSEGYLKWMADYLR
jgi:periplasmic divalent cation tolerance protein